MRLGPTSNDRTEEMTEYNPEDALHSSPSRVVDMEPKYALDPNEHEHARPSAAPLTQFGVALGLGTRRAFAAY